MNYDEYPQHRRDRDRGVRERERARSDWGERGRERRMEGRIDRSRRHDHDDDPRYDRRWVSREPSPRQTLPAGMRGPPRTMIEVESEKEIVDTIITCVSEQVERIVRDEVRRAMSDLLRELQPRR